MRIAIIIAPTWSIQTPPLGSATIAGALEVAGHSVFQFDLNVNSWFRAKVSGDDKLWDYDQNRFWSNKSHFTSLILPRIQASLDYDLEKVLQWKPDAVGFSVFDSSKFATIYCAKYLKLRNPNIKIILGGPAVSTVSLVDHGFFSEAMADVAVLGEADETVVELFSKLESNSSLEGCLGIARIDPKGALEFTGIRPNINIDAVPIPSFTGIEFSLYTEQRLPVMMSRGCTAKCTFCAETRYWKNFRSSNASRVFAEFKRNFERYGVYKFAMCDSLINGNFKTLSELADLIIESGMPFQWGGYARLDRRMTPELLEKLARAGLSHLNFGLETGSQKIMNLMEKRVRVEEASKVIKDSHKFGIKIIINIVVGFPGETEEDFNETIRFLDEHIECISWVSTGDTLAIIHGTPLALEPKKFGIATDSLGKVLTDKDGSWISEDGTNTDEVRRDRLRRLQVYLSQFSHIHWTPGGEVPRPPKKIFPGEPSRLALQSLVPKHLSWSIGSYPLANPATFPTEPLHVQYIEPNDLPKISLRNAMRLAAEASVKKAGTRTIAIPFSGGVISEALVETVSEITNNFELYFLDRWGTNSSDLEIASRIAIDRFKRELNVVSLNRRDFYIHFLPEIYFRYNIEFPHYLVMTALFDKIPSEHFILSSEGSIDRQSKLVSNFHERGVLKDQEMPFFSADLLYYLWASENNRRGVFYFFHSTPALFSALLQNGGDIREKLLCEFPEIQGRRKSRFFDGSNYFENQKIRTWLKEETIRAERPEFWTPQKWARVEVVKENNLFAVSNENSKQIQTELTLG